MQSYERLARNKPYVLPLMWVRAFRQAFLALKALHANGMLCRSFDLDHIYFVKPGDGKHPEGRLLALNACFETEEGKPEPPRVHGRRRNYRECIYSKGNVADDNVAAAIAFMEMRLKDNGWERYVHFFDTLKHGYFECMGDISPTRVLLKYLKACTYREYISLDEHEIEAIREIVDSKGQKTIKFADMLDSWARKAEKECGTKEDYLFTDWRFNLCRAVDVVQ